jgi:hypothetical protein
LGSDEETPGDFSGTPADFSETPEVTPQETPDETPNSSELCRGEKKLMHEKPVIPSSPILLAYERKQAKEFGFSLDTKLMNDEFFFIDLEKMWFWLAIAIQRQIHFSRGFTFLDDLAAYLKSVSWIYFLCDNLFYSHLHELINYLRVKMSLNSATDFQII